MTHQVRVVGDTHLQNKYPGQLETQIKTLLKLCEGDFLNVIFLGDIFENRIQSAEVLLAFKYFLDKIKYTKNITILRGNHDSQNKSDNGLTSLSLFERDGTDIDTKNVDIVTHTSIYDWSKFAYIPHYENEQRIIDDLLLVKPGQIVCGHFGFKGCLNSTGDADFGIPLECFKNKTYLGHIHHFNKPNDLVTIVGTPYSTSFGESGKQCYIIDLVNDVETVVKIDFGPRFLTVEFDKLKEKKEYIEDPKYHTFLRVLIKTISQDNKVNVGKEIEEIVKVPYYEIKFTPSFEMDEEISSYHPDKSLLEIDDSVIEEYVKNNLTGINYNSVMEGLKLLK